MQLRERGAVFGRDEIDDGSSPQDLDVVSFDHREARGIHVQQASLRVEELYALGLALHDRTKAGLAIA